MRNRLHHHHPCSRCKAKTECQGEMSENYDGWPEYVCDEYHTLANQEFRAVNSWLCDACSEAVEAEYRRELAEQD